MDNTFAWRPGLVDMIDGGIIETFLEKVIDELGATGVLVIGLYLFLSRPLTAISASLRKVDKRLCALMRLKERAENNGSEANT